MVLQRIEIQKEFGFSELEERLREVKLKGFSEIRIYRDAKISVQKLDSKAVEDLYIPQPTVYRKGFLDRIEAMQKLFNRSGIDVFCLNGGVDYVAFDENGQATQWTLIPPVAEVNLFNFVNGTIDYSNLLGEDLKKVMQEKGHELNPELKQLNYPGFDGAKSLPLVCDGSHRIHSAYEREITQNVLMIEVPKSSEFPYYAAPRPYSLVHVEDIRPDEGSAEKIHVLTSPGHKLLYRLFPSGGILSGDVRPDKTLAGQ